VSPWDAVCAKISGFFNLRAERSGQGKYHRGTEETACGEEGRQQRRTGNNHVHGCNFLLVSSVIDYPAGMAGEVEQQQYELQHAQARATFRTAHSTHAGAHWLKMIGLATPLAIGEFVKDPDTRWKWTRLAILFTALAEEGFWAHRVKQDNAERQGGRQ
jgi:hypothetical protein